MSENYEIVKGFQTEQGQALYDYDSLHGKPDIDALILASEERMQNYTDNEISEFKIPIDPSLSKAGEAADAEAVGVALKAIEDSKVQVDKDFINEGQAADAKAVGVALKAIEDSKVQIDTSLTEEGQAADAKATGLKIQEASDDTKDYIDKQLEQIQLEGVPYYGSEEEDAIVEDFVYATHLGGALAEDFAKKADVSGLGLSIEDRLDNEFYDRDYIDENFISQSNIDETIDSKGYAKTEEVDSKIENLTAEQVGAAPAGYGLGTSARPIDDWNDAIQNGWYRDPGGAANSPFPNHFTMGFVSNFVADCVQTVYAREGVGSNANPLCKIRTYDADNKAWGEWKEWSPSAFAPAGYGLGGTNVSTEASRDANELKDIGWYTSNVNTPNSEWWYVHVAANYSNAVIIQEAWYYFGTTTAPYAAVKATRTWTNIDSRWSEWEWVNPPMMPKTEYRTTKRYNGKPVYIIYTGDLGGLSETIQTRKDFYPSGGIINEIVSCNGNVWRNGEAKNSFPFVYSDGANQFALCTATANGSILILSPAGNLSTFNHCEFTVEYTKLADG